MNPELIFSTILSLAVIGLLVLLLKKPLQSYFSLLSQKIIDESLKKAEEKSREVFKSEEERLNKNVEQQLESGRREMDNKKDHILEALHNLKKDIEQNRESRTKSDNERISQFSKLTAELSEQRKISESLKVSTDNLGKVLSNNQMRGAFGQQIAEDLLKIAGFVKGQDYVSQTQQDSTKTIPDFTVFLPDNIKINVDVKFPFQALQRYQNTEAKDEKQKHLEAFRNDVRSKFKQITSREYINSEANTVDFAVMFIPNEMIFSFIYETYPDIWHEALQNKIVMCGPFSFTAILRMVRQAYDHFRYQKNLSKIINHIKTFEVEYNKFSEAFDTLGKRLTSTTEQFNTVSGVRDRQLTKVIDKIKSEEAFINKSEDLILESGGGIDA